MVGFADRCFIMLSLFCKTCFLVHTLFFPHPPSKVGGHLLIVKCKVFNNQQIPLLLTPFSPWLYARESGCIFYPIGVVPHIAIGSSNTIICLFVLAKLFPELKIEQIFLRNTIRLRTGDFCNKNFQYFQFRK